MAKEKRTYAVGLNKGYTYWARIEAASAEEAKQILAKKVDAGEIEYSDYLETSKADEIDEEGE